MLGLQLETAANARNPITKLAELLGEADKADRRAPGDTFALLTTLIEKEQESFDEYVKGDPLIGETDTQYLRGYAALTEELVGRFKDLVDAAQDTTTGSESSTIAPNGAPTLAQVIKLHGQWATLMFNELTYLSRESDWDADHGTLVRHACGVIDELFAVDFGAGCEQQRAVLVAGLEQASKSVLQSSALKAVISYGIGLDAACTVQAIFLLAEMWESDLPREMVSDLLPVLHQRLKALCSEDYEAESEELDDWLDEEDSEDEWGDTDEGEEIAAESDEAEGIDQEEDPDFEDEWNGADEGEEIAADSDEAEGIDQEENPDFEDEWNGADEGEEIAADSYEAESIAQEARRERQENEVIEKWETAFFLGLEVLHKMSKSDRCADQLLEILLSSPFEMPERQQVVDALVCVSDTKLREYLALLVDKGREDQFVCHGILSIADFSARMKIERPYKPFQILTETLTDLSRNDRVAILENCKVLVNHFDELFDQPEITKEVLNSLLKTFEDDE